jgi:hypothetical protein
VYGVPVGIPVGVGTLGCGMKGYWPPGSDFATTIVVGMVVVAGYHQSSVSPEAPVWME